jgi:hypothetical protein
MKCEKAHHLYFESRDGLLDEPGRMKLVEHLSACSSCARFVKEMEASLERAKELPELTVPDGFEWNVKRRILQERTKLMRRENIVQFGDRRWFSRFAIGGAAAAAVVVLAAVLTIQQTKTPVPSVTRIAPEDGASNTAMTVPYGSGGISGNFFIPGSYAGPRMVSDNILAVERGGDRAGQAPFQFVAGSREDSLARENEMLKVRIQNLDRQIMILRSMLDRERMRQINTSLP